MTGAAMIAKMIASNFEATPNNAPLTYCVSHHPPFECGTVGDLLSLIGKLERPHEAVTSPLDIDALEATRVVYEAMAAKGVYDPLWTEKRNDYINSLVNAAPALIALARRVQQDAAREGTHAPDCHLWDRRHYDCLLGKYEASRAEIGRLREALKTAEIFLSEDLDNRFRSDGVWGPSSAAPKEECDALAKVKAALTSPAPVSP